MPQQYNKAFFDPTPDRSNPSLPSPPSNDEIKRWLNSSDCPLSQVVVSKRNEPAMEQLRTYAFNALKKHDHSCRGMNFGFYCGPGQGKTHTVKAFGQTIGIPMVFIQSDALESTWMLFELIAKEFETFGWPLVPQQDDYSYAIPPCIVWFDEAQALSKDLRTGGLLNAMEYNDGFLRTQPPGKNQKQYTIDCYHICWIASSTDPGAFAAESPALYERLSEHIIWYQDEQTPWNQSEGDNSSNQTDLITAGGIERPIPLDHLLGLLTSYARAIPHHGLGDLGAVVEVRAALRIPVYRITWATLFERREVVERQAPHDESRTFPPPRFTIQDLDGWAVSLPPPPHFLSGSSELAVSGSEAVDGCGQCLARGVVVCDYCGGHRALSCGDCNGSGCTLCSNCGGRGQSLQIYEVQRTRICRATTWVGNSRCRGGWTDWGQPCGVCNGTGKEEYMDYQSQRVPCLNCNSRGSQVCPTCGGGRVVTCPKCSGYGQVSCSTCQGNRQILRYLAVVRSHEVREDGTVFPCQHCPQEVVHGLSEHRQVLDRMSIGPPLDPSLGSMLHVLDDPIRMLRDKVQVQAGVGERRVGDRLAISGADAIRLDYTFGGKFYTAWFAGENGLVHAPHSPVTEVAARHIEDALAAWKEGRQKDAIRVLRPAVAMAKKSPECRAVLEARLHRIPEELMRRGSAFSLSWWLGNVVQEFRRGLLGTGESEKQPAPADPEFDQSWL